MAYDLEIVGNCVHIRFRGQLTVGELSEVLLRLDAIEQPLASSPHRLADISAVENLALNFDAVEDFTDKRRAVKLKNPVRSAIVAKTPVQYGIARMFQLLSQQPQTEVAVFHEPQAALQWIQEAAVLPVSPPKHPLAPVREGVR